MENHFLKEGVVQVDYQLIAKAAMLHDIGKVCIRSSVGERKSHSVAGSEYIRQFWTKRTPEEEQQILNCIRYHHAKELSGAKLDEGDLAYIVYEADNIAAGADRRQLDEKEKKLKFDSHASLANGFNVFSGKGDGTATYFRLKGLDTKEAPNYPRAQSDRAATEGEYSALLNVLTANFKRKSPADMTGNELLRILEDTLLYVPSSTNTAEHCDISLYDHVKITAAAASAMARYFDAEGITNLKKVCMTENQEWRKKDMFLLVSADFSGIQDFIYRVETKGALRMLRGRSFYLDIVLENAADEILEKLGLTRANLIYCGGGHFYLLADNTEETRSLLSGAVRAIDRKLAELFSASLYVAMAWVPVAASELLGGEGNGSGDPFRRVGEALSSAKQKRYDADMLRELFDERSALNATETGTRECTLCHRSVPETQLEEYLAPDTGKGPIAVCGTCNSLYALGKEIIDGGKPIYAVTKEPCGHALPLPSPFGETWLSAMSEEEAMTKEGSLRRIYVKNRSGTSEYMATRLWVGEYIAREPSGVPLDFADMARASGGEESGIKRLGILRADVDGLGAAFIAGLPANVRTLSRQAALSRSMSMFFKWIINKVCKKELPEGQKPFYLFQDKKGMPRKVHIVYSGGDDLFLAGAWDDLLEFAVDLREAFGRYTNGKLSFSAGLGLFSPSYPILKMAADAGELEDAAKHREGKDSIALFGGDAPVFSWTEFTKEVCGEKLQFLKDNLKLTGINEAEPGAEKKLPVGKSLLYRLLTLLREERFNLARFAYTLARMEPSPKAEKEVRQCYINIREQIFSWAKQEADRKQLVTALYLVIYQMRDK